MSDSSFMILLARNEEIFGDPAVFIQNLSNSETVSIVNLGMSEEAEGALLLELTIEGRPCQAVLTPEECQVPPYFRQEHLFSDEEIESLQKVSMGLGVDMVFKDDSARCFHDQIKLLHALCPDLLAVMDCSAEKLLSGRWVSLAALSKIPPAPRYMFTVQAVVGDEDQEEVWLHTHGLKRCGLYELEILGSTKAMAEEHYHILENFAYRMLDKKEPLMEGEPLLLARAADHYLVVTAINWKKALSYYPGIHLGDEKDRDDEVHGEGSCVVMMYRNEKEESLRKVSPVQEFDPYLKQNPMYMISTAETERMSRLAFERIPYMVRAFFDGQEDKVILVKLGLTTDRDHWEGDTPVKEHIWFEVKDILEEGMVAELTQEPYYVSGLKEGDRGTYSFDMVTDWIIMTKEAHITPDDVYRLKV